MSVKSPFTTKSEKGGYSAIVYIDGDLCVAEDTEGTVLKEGTAAAALQSALNAKRDVSLLDDTLDIGSTTLTLQNKDMNIHGTGINSIIKGSADPLIDVTLTNEYQFRMQKLGIHTTSTNKGIYIDNCTSRLPLWLTNVHFVPEGHAGTLLYIKGLSTAQISQCSFQEAVGATTAKGIYMTADETIFSQELYLNACSFYHLNYGIQGYALPAHRDHLAGIHIAGTIFFQDDYPIHFQNADDITVVGNTIESPLTGGSEKGVIMHDTYECRILGNRLTTRTTGAQLEFIGENLDSYKNIVVGNYLKSYGRLGDGILLDSSPGDKGTKAIINDNFFDYMVNAVEAIKGASAYPQIVFNGNHVWDCTWNITGDITHSIILGNIWGAGCSSTVVNGTSVWCEIVHNHKD